MTTTLALVGEVAAIAFLAATVAGTVYVLIVARLVRAFAARPCPRAAQRPPVTILKPLCGDEPGLYENLRSFCIQDYPMMQVVFGVREHDDPAVKVVHRLMRDLPNADLILVMDRRGDGANRKVANLINMTFAIRHPVIVIADSDMRVGPDYLASVVAPLADPRVGLVTCPYVARPAGAGLWERLGIMAINYGFLPSVLAALRLGRPAASLGATMALRAETLSKIGDFAALKDQLADDHALGVAVARLGLTVELSRYVVETSVTERSLAELYRHEVRWSRTIASITPWAFAASAVRHPLAHAVVAMALTGFRPAAVALAAAALAAQAGLAHVVDRSFGLPATPALLLPFRDILSIGILIAAFSGNEVTWRGRRLRVGPDGRLQVEENPRS